MTSAPIREPDALRTDALMQARHLRKSYGSLVAVDDISFDIRQGEIFGLLGPNGAGKTTTISMLAGILRPTEGEITLDGQPHRGQVATRRLLGVVPQELAIYLRLTGHENLAFFGELYGLSGNALQSRITEMLQLVGLSERAGDLAEKYSGGMKRRLNLATGLMHRPTLLLLDEPTVGVDPQSRNHIFEGVRALNRQGLTVLYTSHYMEEVQALCNRVGIMDAGRMVACDTVQNLIATHGSALIEIGVAEDAPLARLREELLRVDAVDSVELDTRPEPNSEQPSASDAAPDTTRLLLARTNRPNQALPGLVTCLSTLNVPLLSLNVRQPSLESVFLALTGKSLRD